MLVAHLVRELLKCPQDAQVFTEGCDCTGMTSHVEITDDEVYIARGTNRIEDNYKDTKFPLKEVK